jgi:hypothetical protein
MAMGASGQRPSLDASARRNRSEAKAWTEVPDQLYADGRCRELPGGAAVWCEHTRRWWEALRTMPHCRLWGESDWMFAETTALLHQQIWAGEEDPGAKVTELARRERYLGFTREARDGMRIRYVPAEQPQQATLAAVPTIGPAGRQRPRPIDPGPAQ